MQFLMFDKRFSFGIQDNIIIFALQTVCTDNNDKNEYGKKIYKREAYNRSF